MSRSDADARASARRRTQVRRRAADDRGVSITVNYALNLAIATLLIAALLTATGDMVADRRESATETELEVVGQRLAADVQAVDRLARAGGSDSEVVVETSLPARVAGSTYDIGVTTSGGDTVLELTTDVPEVTVTVPLTTATTVETGSLAGGNVVVTLAADGELEVRPA